MFTQLHLIRERAHERASATPPKVQSKLLCDISGNSSISAYNCCPIGICRNLCAQGLEAIVTGPDGDGWQLPETLRLADYGLGHDTRAHEPQPVASRLGPRFLDWHLKDPAQSWAECEARAAQLNALWSHARTLAGATASEAPATTTISATSPEPTIRLAPNNQREFQF